MKHTPLIDMPHPAGSGVQKIYAFDNGYGASVVRFTIGVFGGSYGSENGLWELAVIAFKEPVTGPVGHRSELPDYEVVYDTPITNDVEGHLTEQDVDDLLDRIAALPDRPGTVRQIAVRAVLREEAKNETPAR